MASLTARAKLDEWRRTIARGVRRHRKERRWTQAQLAARLGVTQAWVSIVERGEGSLSAEQLLLLLQLFNATLDDFGARSRDREGTLQNALARLGAFHLAEDGDELPSERLAQLHDVLRETLILAESSRLIAGLAPVLVRNARTANLLKVQRELELAGHPRRLPWVVDNTLSAIRTRLKESPPRSVMAAYRRAETMLESFMEVTGTALLPRGKRVAPDVVEADVRSKETLREILAAASPPSRRWRIVSNLQTHDFVDALRHADVAVR
jgi:transcriptional regulator with XRE-family HTH domain